MVSLQTSGLRADQRQTRNAVIRGEGGKLLGFAKAVHDVTERNRIEELFQLVVEETPCAMIVVSADALMALVNAQTEKLFGYNRSELLGQPVEMLLSERFRAGGGGHANPFFAALSAQGPEESPDLFGRRKDGSEVPIEIGLNPVSTSQGHFRLVSIVDATARKFNERQQQTAQRTAQLIAVNHELEEFAYVASHDLKAPLRVIDNASKWLEEDLQEHFTDETREHMNILRNRVRRMDKLLDDLLDYARIGLTPDNCYFETIDGDELMDNVLALLPATNFTLRVSPSFTAIRVRRMPLQQILLNLISNAIKHHDKKTGNIDVTVQDDGAYYTFAVKDDGPGIPPQFHDQIFKMFRTLRSGAQAEGSGMGLAMVRKNAKVFGGTLQLVSAEGEGSTFRLTWPKNQQLNREAA